MFRQFVQATGHRTVPEREGTSDARDGKQWRLTKGSPGAEGLTEGGLVPHSVLN